MKNVHSRSLLMLLIIVLMASLNVHADESRLLPSLHQFRVSNFVALNSYYQFSVNGDPVKLNEIVEGINSANSDMNAVTENSKGALSDKQLADLTTEFDKYKDLMRQNINDVRKNGYPDLRLVSEMANQAQVLSNRSTELYNAALESAATQSDPRVESARTAAVLMAQMMSKYSARSNSSSAQTFQGSESEAPLDQQAKQFDTLIARVEDGSGTAKLKKIISSVSSKWQFIRGSYINYNEDNVPFIIDRYSKGILNGLANAIDMLTGKA